MSTDAAILTNNLRVRPQSTFDCDIWKTHQEATVRLWQGKQCKDFPNPNPIPDWASKLRALCLKPPCSPSHPTASVAPRLPNPYRAYLSPIAPSGLPFLSHGYARPLPPRTPASLSPLRPAPLRWTPWPCSPPSSPRPSSCPRWSTSRSTPEPCRSLSLRSPPSAPPRS